MGWREVLGGAAAHQHSTGKNRMLGESGTSDRSPQLKITRILERRECLSTSRIREGKRLRPRGEEPGEQSGGRGTSGLFSSRPGLPDGDS